MNRGAQALVVSALALQAACFPYKYTSRPAVSGTVLSAADGTPIVGALVHDPASTTYRTKTREDGTFSLTPEKEWGIWFILPQEPMSVAQLRVTATGYKEYLVSAPGWRSMATLEVYVPGTTRCH